MAPSAATPQEWLRTFEAAVRARDFAGGRELFASDAMAFGTWARAVAGLDNIVREQWQNVWPRIRGFAFEPKPVVRTNGDSAWIAVGWQSEATGPDGKIVGLLGLDLMDHVENDHAFGHLGRVILELAARGPAAPDSECRGSRFGAGAGVASRGGALAAPIACTGTGIALLPDGTGGIVLDGFGPIKSLNRSWSVTRGNAWRLLGLYLLLGLLFLIFLIITENPLIAGFLFPVLGITLTLGGGVLGAIILAFIGAVILLVIVRLFKQIAA